MNKRRERWIAGVARFCVIAMMAMRAKAATGLLSSDYLPHRFCYLAKPWLVWTNVATDVLIGVSYGLLFSCLLWIAIRLKRIEGMRRHLWIFLSFGSFILVCGATHVMEVVTVWLPVYPLSAAFKVICAAVSVPTAVYFARMAAAVAGAFENYLEAMKAAKVQRDSALVALSATEVLVKKRERASQQLLEATSDCVVTIGHDWTLLYANRNALRQLPEFKAGENYWDCFPAMVATPQAGLLRRAMKDRTEVSYEIDYEPYGMRFSVRGFPIEDGLGFFFNLVTEERYMQEQLELEKLLREKRIIALSHMAAGLAHEISNPLAIIHGRAFELRSIAESDRPLGVEEVRIACDSIVKTADRATAILRGLRGFAREGSHDPMELACMDEIVEQAQEMQQTRFDRNDIELRMKGHAETPLLMCRRTQIGQIITNLLNNAFDAIVESVSKDRWVTVTAEQFEDEIWTDVTDGGTGVEDRFREHVMEPFFTTKALGLGMGVGLSLSRAIAEDHGGTLTLLKDTEHTCFRLILPLRQTAARRAGNVFGGVPFN